MQNHIELEKQYGAHNYAPIPIVLSKGEGSFVFDEKGNRYIDMMGAYSAVSFGHCQQELVETLCKQARQLDVVSRAFYHDKLSAFLEKACQLSGYDAALPMNTGAEAVETALKVAKRYGYQHKKIPEGKAEIIACHGNFHGRTIAIVGLSSESEYQQGFGPFPAGTILIPFGDIEALKAAITPHTAAFLVEPIQGEGGIRVPPEGYLQEACRICQEAGVLLLCDEVQTGMGRTGKDFAFQHDACQPDGLILGKALGGGLLPVSLFLCRREVMDVLNPGSHGSTFGGYPLAAAVGLNALELLERESYSARASMLGTYVKKRLEQMANAAVLDIRGKGLLIGLELDPQIISARDFCLKLMEKGVLTKDTHHTVVRLAPPLNIEKPTLDLALNAIGECLNA